MWFFNIFDFGLYYLLITSSNLSLKPMLNPQNVDEKVPEPLYRLLYRRQKVQSLVLTIEICIYFIGFIISFQPGFQKIRGLQLEKYGYQKSPNLFEVIDGTKESWMILIVPLLFFLVFSQSPLQFLRRKYAPLDKEFNSFIHDLSNKVKVSEDEITADVYYKSLLESSQKLAKQIFTRSQVYLFVGSLIALGGLGYITSVLPHAIIETDGKESFYYTLPALIPRFGILIFLELLAFFFLRQYKSTMDEFRYYDGIQRLREEKFFYIKTLAGNVDSKEMLGMLSEIDPYDRLSTNDKSLILESKRLYKDEFELLNKLIDKIPVPK